MEGRGGEGEEGKVGRERGKGRGTRTPPPPKSLATGLPMTLEIISLGT